LIAAELAAAFLPDAAPGASGNERRTLALPFLLPAREISTLNPELRAHLTIRAAV
jgi:hypothetical protein